MRSLVCWCVLGFLGFSATSKAIVIDSFDDGGSFLSQGSVGATSSGVTASVLGGVRRARLEVTSQIGNPVATMEIGGGFATVSTGLDQFHVASLGYGYDVFGTPVGLGQNMADQIIRVRFTYSDLPLRMTVRLFSNNNTADVATYTLALIGGLNFGTTEDLPVNDFSASGSFSATNVSQILFSFESNAPRGANDYQLGDIQMVPEPATMCILGLGALVLVRRRKK